MQTLTAENKMIVDKVRSLAVTHPDVAIEWHPIKNGELTPDKVMPGSNKKVWWKCTKGDDHEYESVISTKTKQKVKCPICSNKKVILSNSLYSLMPVLAQEWHPTKNGDLTPQKCVPGSHQRVWWLCKMGHEWQCTIKSRSTANTGCAICKGRRASPSTSLTALYPKVASEWHPTKNGELTPDKVVPGSNIKVWWKCSKGDDHEWKVAVFYRTKNKSKCPICLNQKCVSSNSLATLFPEIAKDWDYNKNKEKTPINTVPGCHTKIWWRCSKNNNHSYQATISNRIKNSAECLKCNEENNSILKTHTEIAKEWHPTKNLPLQPNEVSRGSRKKIWWKCKNGHVWSSILKERTCGNLKCSRCPKDPIIKENNLNFTHPHLIEEWCFDRNIDISPEHLTSGSHKKIWWNCKQGHFWQAVVSSRTKQGSGCPYCSGLKATKQNNITVSHPELLREWHPTKNEGVYPNQLTSGSDKRINWICKNGHEWVTSVYERAKRKTGCIKCPRNLKVRKNNLTETHPHLLQEWCFEKNTSITPLNVVFGSKVQAWWRCKRGHEWKTSINHRTVKLTGCPYCCGKKVTADNNLSITHPDLAKEWNYDKNNEIRPQDVTFGVGKKYWWKCSNGHEWQATPNNRSNAGSGCRLCSSQSSTEEVRLFCELKTIFTNIKWREKIEGVELDIYIPHLNVGIEIDGSYWHKNKITKDLEKNAFFLKKGIKVLRLKDNQYPYEIPDSHTFNVSNLNVDDVKILLKMIRNECEKILSFTEKDSIINYSKLNDFKNKMEFEKKLNYFPGPQPKHSLKHLYPLLCEEWDYEKNASLKPENFKAGSDKKIWWLCDKMHSWQASIYERAKRKSGCPFCNGKRVCNDNNLTVTHPFVSIEWHPTKNENLKPSDVRPGSNKKVWWLCNEEHEWFEMINNRTSRKFGCPICFRNQRNNINKIMKQPITK